MDYSLDSPHSSNHSSPHSLHDYDQDHLDSSSSSSGEHSSPSSDSASSEAMGAAWAYDLGLSVPALVGVGMPEEDWGAAAGMKGTVLHGMMGDEGDEAAALALTSDFWSTAPSTTVHSPAGAESRDFHMHHKTVGDLDVKPEIEQSGEEMEVEFDDVVHEDLCGPSSLHSPISLPCPSPRRASFAIPALFPMPSSPPPAPAVHAALYFPSSMSMPVDLLAVNAGISPLLTEGKPSPPIDVMPETLEGYDWANADMAAGRRRSSLSSAQTGPSTRDSSASRQGKAEEPTVAVRAGGSGPGSVAASMTTTNLVTKDAIVAAAVISSLGTPAPASISSASGLQLLVLGVPSVGAKSRVETQIKISLVLVGPKRGASRRVKVEGEAEEGAMSQDGLTTSDGGLSEDAGRGLERIGSWSHIRLPKYLALKKINKKLVKPDPPAEDTLFLSVSVLRGTEPHEEIFICQGCQQREHKRAQRKKDARVRSVSDGAAANPNEEDEERRKVVVFNCPEFVDFDAGEVVLPTRITCYCRHHKERKGFSVAFTLRTAAGVVVAHSTTPPIMITDDHKTSVRPSTVTNSTAASVAASTNGSVDSIDLSVVAPVPAPSKASKTKAALKLRLAKEAIAKSETASPPGRPKRNAGRKLSHALTESDEGDDASPPATTSRGAPAGKKHVAAAKPYDSDARPRKRQSGVHRSPSFAMTPLVMSKASSPVLRPVPDALALSGSHGGQPWEAAALGLGGMTDAVMQDAGPSVSIVHSRAGSAASIYIPASGDLSTASSNAPSPAQSGGWRSSASSPPPLSPGSGPTSAGLFSPFSLLTSPDVASTAPSSVRSGLNSPPLTNRDHAFFGLYSPTNTSFPAVVAPAAAAGSSAMNWAFAAPPPPPPRISRLIPGEGPVHGGIEVTVLGENFVRDLVCVFGDAPAVPTHFWSSNTLVCILPPSANPGPVVVGIKGVPLSVEEGTGLQLFTYKDDSDRSLLELALQVVGLKMTGRLEDASSVAKRIVGVGNTANGVANAGRPNGGTLSRTPSATDATDTAGLAMRMNAATASAAAYASPSASRSSSRAPSRRGSPHASPNLPTVALPYPDVGGETRNFEGIVIKFLLLLDLDPSLIPGSAPSVPLARSPISHANNQGHTLLHLATLLGFHRLVQFLLVRNIDVESADRNGFTALHFAALYGRVAITRQLLDAGATSSARNLAGKTPADIARDRDDVDVGELFLRSRPPTTAVSSRPAPQQLRFSPRAAHSRLSSRPTTPIYEYARSVISDYAESSSEDESDWNDDGSFHSSDEEDDAASSDVERRLSRSASMVSLHYLLEAEADVNAEYASTCAEAEPVTEDEQASEGSYTEDELVRDLPSKTDPSSAPSDSHPSTALRDLAWASSTWLSRNLKPSLPYPPTFNKLPQLPIAGGVTGVWEKTNGAWEKMRLPNAFALPLQLQDLTAFQTMAWRGTKSEGTVEGADVGTSGSPPSVDSKSVFSVPWWHAKSSASPPPEYTPTDTLQKSAPPPATALLPSTSTSASTSTALQAQAKGRRRIGYSQDETLDTVVEPLQLMTAKKVDSLGHDRMLYFFWLPVLLLAVACALYSSFSPYIRPAVLATVDTVFPFSRTVKF